jgi:hypothetical protein
MCHFAQSRMDAGVIALAVQNGNPTAEEKMAGRALGALAMQEEAHELRVLERVGNEHTDPQPVTRYPPPLVIRPRIVKTNLAEVPPKHVKLQSVSAPVSDVSDGWKNLGAVSGLNVWLRLITFLRGYFLCRLPSPISFPLSPKVGSKIKIIDVIILEGNC